MTKDRLTTDVLVIRMKLNISELNSNVQKDEGDLCLLQLLYLNKRTFLKINLNIIIYVLLLLFM